MQMRTLLQPYRNTLAGTSLTGLLRPIPSFGGNKSDTSCTHHPDPDHHTERRQTRDHRHVKRAVAYCQPSNNFTHILPSQNQTSRPSLIFPDARFPLFQGPNSSLRQFSAARLMGICVYIVGSVNRYFTATWPSRIPRQEPEKTPSSPDRPGSVISRHRVAYPPSSCRSATACVAAATVHPGAWANP